MKIGGDRLRRCIESQHFTETFLAFYVFLCGHSKKSFRGIFFSKIKVFNPHFIAYLGQKGTYVRNVKFLDVDESVSVVYLALYI